MISAVANDADVMLVLGVNDDAYDPERHRIVSNASCTTNCVTPMAKVLHDAFGIERGFMTTVHAYTASQPRPRRAAQGSAPGARGGDQPDPDDDRRHPRARHVLPELEGKIGAIAIRAPVPVGSIVDLVVQVSPTRRPR